MSLRTLWWFSVSLRVGPKVLSTPARPTWSDPPPLLWVWFLSQCPSFAQLWPHRPPCSSGDTQHSTTRVSALAAPSGMFFPKHLHNFFHILQVSTQLLLIRETFPDHSVWVSTTPLLSLSISLSCFTFYSPWNGIFICLSPHYHESSVNFRECLYFNAKSLAPWTVPGT